MNIKFIAGKNVSTKSVASKTVTIHAEVPEGFDNAKFQNVPLKLVASGGKLETPVEFDCSLSTEGVSFYYSSTHESYAIKLDVILPDLLLIGLLLVSDLSLKKP